MVSFRARASIVAVTIAAGLWALTAVAGAHPWLDEASVPADSNQQLRLNVPVESEDSTVGNEEIDLHLPVEFTGLGCIPSFGWTCDVDQTDQADVVVRWTRVGGRLRPEAFDFVVRTPPTEGEHAFVVDQRRSDLSITHWADAPSGAHPSPRLRVTAADSDPEPNLAPPADHTPTTTPVPSGQPATTPAAQGPPAGPSAPRSSDGTAGSFDRSRPSSTIRPGATASTVRGAKPRTAIADIPEVGEPDAVPPGEVSLGLPRDSAGAEAKLTPARVAVGLAAVFGALMTWLLLRRAKVPA